MLVAIALGVGSALGAAACGDEDRGDVQIETSGTGTGGTSTAGTETAGTESAGTETSVTVTAETEQTTTSP